ncbi:MAG: hypothetical protein MUC83_14700 [Pirellula sp.]|nr:hypothetical protein [Pirellula sp.]
MDQRETMYAEGTPTKLRITSDFVGYARRYAHEKPEIIAIVCVGIGFILGWKLKPW